MTPHWTEATSLDAAVDETIRAAMKQQSSGLALPFTLNGSSRQAIDQQSARLSKPIPKEMASLYERLGGYPNEEAPWDECLFFLYDLERTFWLDPKEEHWPPDSGWSSAGYFVIGQGIYGDCLTYCENPPLGPTGSIVLLDHEDQGPQGNPDQPGMIVRLADSLAQWLTRLTAFNFMEYGYTVGGICELPDGLRESMKADHERLNPGVFVPE